MFLTDDYIRKRYSEWLGDIDSMVGEERSERLSWAQEKLRALWVLQATEGKMSASKALSLYMVRKDVAKDILAEFDSGDDEGQALRPRKEKYSALNSWCKENIGYQVTTKELAEIGEISYPTALKYITDRPDIFWKVARGTYEVRDPAADRKKDKS